MRNKIAVFGMGYVGCSNALMLAKNNEVVLIDIDQDKITEFNLGKLPIADVYAQQYLDQENLKISASSDLEESISECTFIILALPTNFDSARMKYDTDTLDEVAEKVLRLNSKATIVIKSTVDIGYTEHLKQKLDTERVVFSPEFLREGHALEDNLFPSRIIVGGIGEAAIKFSELMKESVNNSKAPILIMPNSEAESVKLFANTYLAMRVAFFNELDTFCLENLINTKDVIEGISLDRRIGNYYNNPSFGFGGLCLPKDSMQLLQRAKNAPHSIIKAIQDSNNERASFLVNKIISQKHQAVGIYKLAMKKGSDNSRDSSIFRIIDGMIENKINVIVYDESHADSHHEELIFIKDFNEFTSKSDLIITNRLDEKILPFKHKVFSRDIFSSDE
jgi:UDPglucose 6-dehydrogenase